MIGTTLGPYRIESQAGRGGMGIVYRATDTRLQRPVAIKLLPADAIADPDRKARFVREAQAASALNHSNIVTIYQIGTEGSTDFIAMEFVVGRSLDQVINRRVALPRPGRRRRSHRHDARREHREHLDGDAGGALELRRANCGASERFATCAANLM